VTWTRMSSIKSATIVAVLTRRTDLQEDVLTESAEREEARAAVGHTTFARQQQEGKVAVAEDGLDGSIEWHRTARAAPKVDDKRERAVLMQTTANTAALEAYGKRVAGKLKRPLEPSRPGDWGENLLVDGGDGLDATALCIGDEFEVMRAPGSQVVLRLRVTSARQPCSNVDAKHCSTFSKHGIRAECARTGNGGAFLKVVGSGDVQVGDTLRLAHRPHPQWSLRRCSELLYGDDTAVMKYATRGVLRSEWRGTHKELVELARLPELAVTNWKEQLYRMLGHRGIGCYRGMAPDYQRLLLSSLRHHPLMAPLALLIVVGMIHAVLAALTVRSP